MHGQEQCADIHGDEVQMTPCKLCQPRPRPSPCRSASAAVLTIASPLHHLAADPTAHPPSIVLLSYLCHGHRDGQQEATSSRRGKIYFHELQLNEKNQIN
jgi:hypothetical protein